MYLLKLNSFVKGYNRVRPHEALDMRTPEKIHERLSVPFPERIKKYEYPPHFKVMSITKSGSMRWKSCYQVFLSNVLIGKQVGAEEIGNGVWKV